MNRKPSTKTPPLPMGVKDAQWQPPVAAGLEHSSEIFQTEADERGMLVLSEEGTSESNWHFRTWQEDNGVAGTVASKTVEKDVDGKRITVSITSEASRLSNRLARANTRRPSSADAAVPAMGFLSEGSVPDVKSLRALRGCSPAEECGRQVLTSGEAMRKDSPSAEEGAPGRSSPSADVTSQKVAATPERHAAEEEEAVQDYSLPRKGKTGEDSGSPERGATGQASTSAEEVTGQKVSATPQGVSAKGAVSASPPDCCAQQPQENAQPQRRRSGTVGRHYRQGSSPTEWCRRRFSDLQIASRAPTRGNRALGDHFLRR